MTPQRADAAVLHHTLILPAVGVSTIMFQPLADCIPQQIPSPACLQQGK